jgi:WD40 repeat protein
VSKVYNGISEATKMFIEYRLITSDGKKNSVNFNEVETNAVLCTEILTLVNNPDTRLLSIGQFLDSKHITILHDRLLPPLVKRKVERKAMEEKDALAAKEAALEKDNKKKQRRLILSFIAGALLLSFWLFANIRQQNTIAILKVVADSAAYRAKEDSISVVKMNDSVAGMIKKNASLLDETVFEGRNAAIAIKKLESASKLNQDLKRANKEIIAYTDELASQKKELQGRVDYNDVEKDLRESTITIESFGNRDLFEEVFKSLLGLKKTKQTDQYNKLLFSIEDAIEINKTYGYDANTFYSYSNAKTLWQQNKEFPVIEKILLKNFINTSLFYKQILSLPKSDTSGDKKGKTFLSFNNSGMGRNDIKFSINNGNRVYTGNYMSNKDSIQINKVSNLIPAKTEKLNSLIYANDEIIGLQDNLLFGYSINQKMSPVKNKINVASYTQGTLSPDGNYLVTYSDYDSAILWKLDGLKIKEPIGLTLSPGNYKSILFSGDGNWLLTLSTNDDLRLFNMDSIKLKNSAEAVLKYKGIRAVNFSPESGNLIMMVQNAVFFQDLTHYTKENTFGLAKKILDLPYTVIDYIDPVNSISISADFKKIMIEKIKDLFVIRILNENNKLLSNKNIPVDSVIIRQFKNQAIICNAAFLNTDNILAIDEMGKIFVCEIYPEFKSIANAFNSIKTPPLPLLEQIKMNATNAVFNEIINSGDAVLIENAANTYREKFYDGENSLVQKSDSLDLFHSDTLFKKAIQLYSKNQDANFEPLIKIYSTLRDREISNKGKAPYSLEIVKLEEKYNLKSSKELSLEYSDLSFYTFFQKDFKNALEYIFTAKKLDSTNGIIYTNLALAYLFNNQFANAEKIYMAKMDSSYITNGIPSKYNESFLQDFEDLETAGIINSKEYLLYEEVKKIKSTILTKGKK